MDFSDNSQTAELNKLHPIQKDLVRNNETQLLRLGRKNGLCLKMLDETLYTYVKTNNK